MALNKKLLGTTFLFFFVLIMSFAVSFKISLSRRVAPNAPESKPLAGGIASCGVGLSCVSTATGYSGPSGSTLCETDNTQAPVAWCCNSGYEISYANWTCIAVSSGGGGGGTGNGGGGGTGSTQDTTNSCPSGMVSNGLCEAGLRPLTAANCCKAECIEECPGEDGILRNCTPPEVVGGGSQDSSCSTAGRLQACGGKAYCCPVASGDWTADVTQCPACTASTWEPEASTGCVGTNVTQNSNCGTTRTVPGTKTAGCNGTPTGTPTGGGTPSPTTGACSAKYYFAMTTAENLDGTNQGKCKPTTETYDTALRSCAYPDRTCSQNLRDSIPLALQGTATCYNLESECAKPNGKTVDFRYYYNATLKRCASTTHRYDENDIDVDNTGLSCSKNIESLDDSTTAGVCFKSIEECQTVRNCTDTIWTPAPETVCSRRNLTQTSNCGKTRVVAGTKDCCIDKTWTPTTDNVCTEKIVSQTSNCGKTREVSGTKTCLPDLSISKKVYKNDEPITKVARGEEMVYALEVKNFGEGSAKDIVITDSLTGQNQSLIAFEDSDDKCSFETESKKLSCKIESLAPEATANIKFRVKVDPAAINGKVIRNTGKVTYNNKTKESSVDILVSSVVSCNEYCRNDSECITGLACDVFSNKCRRPSCSKSTDCVCEEPTATVTVRPTAKPTSTTTITPTDSALDFPDDSASLGEREPTAVAELPQTGIFDLPQKAFFGGGILLAVLGLLLAL